MYSPKSLNEIHGVLPIHKPVGMTSKDVSRWLINRFGKVKLGHAGTLDPQASGVLPLLLGRATKLQDYLVDDRKSYEFDVRLGLETDTLDEEGTVIQTASFDHITPDMAIEVAKKFEGVLEQIPPRHSAIKWKGKPLYEYARRDKIQNEDMAQFKRQVFIHSIEIVSLKLPVLTVQVTCSKGTYIRCLGRDLAHALGSCGSLIRLVRTEASGFRLEECHEIPNLQKDLETRCQASIYEKCSLLSRYVVPIDQLKLGIPALHLGQEISDRLLFGQIVKVFPETHCPEIYQRQDFAEVQSTGRHPLGSLRTSIAEIYSEKGFPEEKAVIVWSDNNRAIGIASALVLESGQVSLKLRRGL